MAVMLEFRRVNFDRGARQIFRELCFSVPEGSMTALLGPNGVGKSTLMSLVCGLERPLAGEITVAGRALQDWQRKQLSRTVALVPQTLFVPFSFRVEQIVAQGRVPHLGRFGALSRQDYKVIDAAMDATDVTAMRHRTFDELSGGEMQRVKIAIALAQEPKFMLLDEPTQHLDIGRQVELLRLLRHLNERGITIFAALHDLTLVRENFRKVVLLTPHPGCHAGSVEEVMTPELLQKAFGVSAANFRMPFRPQPAARETVLEFPARAGASRKSSRIN